MQLDLLTLSVLAAFSILTCLVFYACASRRSTRMVVVLITFSQFMYAGYGIAFLADPERYAVFFCVFLVSLLSGFALASNGFLVPPGSLRSVPGRPPVRENSKRLLGRATVAVGASSYIAASVAMLFIPTVRVLDLFRPDLILLSANQGLDIFRGRMARASSSWYTVLGYVKLLTFPLLLIWLKRRYFGKWGLMLGLLCGLAYIDIAAADQWGRTAIIRPILAWLLILLFARRLSGRAFVGLLLLGFAVAVPVLNSVFDWRSGVPEQQAGFLEHLDRFQRAEFSYPMLYPTAETIGAQGSYALPALVWLLTLPIPSSLVGTGFSVTREFSESILGIRYGDPGFYILLPNWLGEAFVLFGPWFWVWAFMVGGVVGLLDRLLSSHEDLLLLYANFATLLVIYSRSVAQEFIAQTVNSLWLLLVLWVGTTLRRVNGRARS